MKILDQKYETMPAAELEQFQLERLQALLARLRRNVRRYRDLIGDTGVESLADLRRLPITTPDDLANAFPYGMFALPLREVIRLHSTVGPEGKQLLIGHTRIDLRHWGRLIARQLAAAGATAHDVLQICFQGGISGKALGYLLGAEMIEASVISEDHFHIEYQLAMLQNCRATVLVTTPTDARALIELLGKRRMDPHSLNLRLVLLSRPVSTTEREELATGLSTNVWSSFGIDEILDPGLCVECSEGNFHVNEDQFLVEVESGELLVTTLCREALPLLRYCTRIACALQREPCACGRTGAILQPGERLDGRFRVNERPLYAAQIAGVLAQTRAAGYPFHLDISERRVVVSLEITPDVFVDTMRALADLKYEIQSEFLARLGIEVKVQYVEGRVHPRQ
jgi:phenylacetate-CoA ligase